MDSCLRKVSNVIIRPFLLLIFILNKRNAGISLFSLFQNLAFCLQIRNFVVPKTVIQCQNKTIIPVPIVEVSVVADVNNLLTTAMLTCSRKLPK